MKHLVVALTLCFAAIASADEVATSGRTILEKNKAAVVTVQLVIKTKFGMAGGDSQNDESKAEATGTVIDPSGLTVVSLTETDPTSLMESMMSNFGGGGFKVDTEVRDVKILLEDGKEVPAEIVLRDKELDMAFVRPVAKSDTVFAFVDLKEAAPAQLLDQVISLSRLGTVARRAPAASIERISAVVDKPRTFYVPGKDPTSTGLGSPAFGLDGKPIGVFLMRAIKDTSGGGGGGMRALLGGMSDNVTVVLLPGADILEGASQVPPYE
jgi:hypothetical protein